MLTCLPVATAVPDEEMLFAGGEAVQIKVAIRHLRLPANASFSLPYQIQNIGDSPLLVSDTDGAGAVFRVVVRDAAGAEIQAKMASDSFGYGATKLQRLARFWFVIPKGHWSGSEVNMNLAGYKSIKVGSRYAVSLHLSSQPDTDITRGDIETIAPLNTRILKGEFDSEPIWITVKPPCCDKPMK
jgi:hypothetical protein